MSKVYLLFAAGALLSGMPILSGAQSDDTFLVQTVSFDQTVEPRGPVEFLNDVAENPQIVAALGAVAAYYGVDPKAVATGAAVIKALTQDDAAEERKYAIRGPHRYVFCRAVFGRNQDGVPDSKVGHGQFGATVVDARGLRYLKVNIWTQRRSIGKGRSWVHMPAQLHYIKREEYENYQQMCASDREVLINFRW